MNFLPFPSIWTVRKTAFSRRNPFQTGRTADHEKIPVDFLWVSGQKHALRAPLVPQRPQSEYTIPPDTDSIKLFSQSKRCLAKQDTFRNSFCAWQMNYYSYMRFSMIYQCINKQRVVVCFIPLQNHNAGCNGSSKEQIARQLNDAVNEVVVNQILTDFLLSSATVHDAGEANDRRSSIGGKPRQGMHDKRKVSF